MNLYMNFLSEFWGRVYVIQPTTQSNLSTRQHNQQQRAFNCCRMSPLRDESIGREALVCDSRHAEQCTAAARNGGHTTTDWAGARGTSTHRPLDTYAPMWGFHRNTLPLHHHHVSSFSPSPLLFLSRVFLIFTFAPFFFPLFTFGPACASVARAASK